MRKQITKLTALSMAAVLTLAGLGCATSTTVSAESSKYITSSVGSSEVTGLQVPTLAYDDTSITLVWEKPEKYDNVKDYNVYINGQKAGTANENFNENAEWASAYMEAFYAGYEAKQIDMVDVDIHSYKATGLTPATEYTFEVRAVDENGQELGSSNKITQSTTKIPDVFNITDFGAKTSEGYTSYNDEINAFIENNTKAIQAAIDACTEGGKVVIPAGTFVTGAIYLKSNITLELQDGAILWGSPNVDHYEQNYLLYPYSTDTRSWSLVNTYSADEEQLYENIRITGNGTIFGNGWKYGSGSSVYKDGVSEVLYQTKDALDPADSKFLLENWPQGKSTGVSEQGILAADAFTKAKAKGLSDSTAYATRPNLVTLRGVNGIYIEGITVKNPAFHTIALLDSENVVSNDVKYITYDCNNADGIEIGNTQNALIFNNFFDTGDDSINFATGLGNGVQDTHQKASNEIWTFNNFIRNGHGGAIAAGSHTGAGISNMLVEDNVINKNEMPFRFKSAPVNGGGIFNVTIRDCAVSNCKQLFTMSTSYGDANQAFAVEPADKPAEFYNISAYNITADKITKHSFSLVADVSAIYKPWHTHHNLYFQDIVCTNITAQSSEEIKGCDDVEFNNVSLNWSSSITSPTPWKTISNSNNIRFTGTTTTSANSDKASIAPVWQANATGTISTSVVKNGSYDTANVDLTWDEATDAADTVTYSIDTYVGEQKVDQIDGISTTSTTIEGLSTSVEYKFVVYAQDSTGNKVEGPTLTVTSAGTKDTTPIITPASSEVTFSGIGYTWGLGKFASARLTDVRVRGYKAYVNGQLSETFYNYKVQNSTTSDFISQNVRRLTAGQQNEVKIVAFTDAGLEYTYDVVTVNTTENYDYKAPVWGNDAELSVVADGDNIVLSWPEATDESGINGYRVYVDGKAVLADSNQLFNHVNGNYTTKETTYTIVGLDLDKEHTFKVEAGDTWWKAAAGQGPYHWTLSGPCATYKKEIVEPTIEPTVQPTIAPTVQPSVQPTVDPSVEPTTQPTVSPVTVNKVTNLTVTSTTSKSIKLSWDKVENADGYVIAYKQNGKWATIEVNGTQYIHKSVNSATTICYKVKAFKIANGTKVYGDYSKLIKTFTLPTKAKLSVKSVANSSIKLSWRKVQGVSGYQVVVYKGNKVAKKLDVSAKATSITIKKLSQNTTYRFKIRGYKVVNGKRYYAIYSNTSVASTKAKATKVSLATLTKKVMVSWKKIGGAKGYEIVMSTKMTSGFKKVATITATSTKHTIKSLKSGSTYYFKVRSYKIVEGKKIYSDYSKVKSIKVK